MDNASTHTEYWNGFYSKRVFGNSHQRNAEKFNITISELWDRPYIAPIEKLDVGCGTGLHAIHMGTYNAGWTQRWTGIDLSDWAIGKARAAGLRVDTVDFLAYEPDRKFGAFLFLDSFEHVMTAPGAEVKLVGLAEEQFIVLGNVPLYLTKHGYDVEVPVDKKSLLYFAKTCGCTFFRSTVYGVKGYPYCVFEFHNYPEPEPWTKHIAWKCIPTGGWERIDE